MKNILKGSILYLIFATSTIFAHYHDNEFVVTINTEDDLRNLLTSNQGPSAISFHMGRCGWCIQMQPIFQDLAENDQFGHITFYRADGPALKASTHIKDVLNEQITGYPTIFFMNQGKLVDKQIGGGGCGRKRCKGSFDTDCRIGRSANESRRNDCKTCYRGILARRKDGVSF